MVKASKSERPYRELRSLGGLSSLYDVAPASTSAPALTSNECLVPLSQIQRSPKNPRKSFNSAKMAQLTASVQRYGVLEPVLLKPLQPVQEPVHYELVFGERRYLAAEAAGLNEIRARILTPEEVQQWKEVDIAQIRLVENLNREDLNAVEETHAIVELLALQLQIPAPEVPRLLYRLHQQHRKRKNEESASSHTGVGTVPLGSLNEQLSQWMNNSDDAVTFERILWEVEYAFEGLGRFSWQSFVQHRLPLLNLPPDVQNAIRTGQIPYSAGKALARITDEHQRQSILEQAIAESWTREQIAEAVRSLLTPQLPVSQSNPDPAIQFQATLRTTVSKLKKAKLSAQKYVEAEKLLQQLLAIAESDSNA
ncbi:ParB/RepB/Spo0J family partition protein [Trichocoleus sp. FACHB-591]|uniref:ParB/RepB/Spo0J family partition protein n=1 Tax=Trichocoleus sp. FACHB-591 TaxID=2692872 RepID=UPI0016833A34|nr:ParB/RepB/Spo0J family partition protein [Trichocoleus sp. FACHB-591]MBD2095860.1 ParB/RepB/Spo0J family partition protein [Trichocoleus sp. FACHB-591]